MWSIKKRSQYLAWVKLRKLIFDHLIFNIQSKRLILDFFNNFFCPFECIYAAKKNYDKDEPNLGVSYLIMVYVFCVSYL